MSETVWIELFKKTGRLVHSQHVVKRCANVAGESGISFKQALLDHEDVAAFFTQKEIDWMLNPENYQGTVEEQINAVIASVENEIDGL